MVLEDILWLSLGINVGLLYYNHRNNTKHKELSAMFSQLMFVMEGLADRQLDIKRRNDGRIEVKDAHTPTMEKANGN